MRLALLADIHANLHALEACLAHAHKQQVSRYAFLGDLVGYGADPVAVVDRIMKLAQAGAVVLRGNHDQMCVHPPLEASSFGEATARWTHAQLDPSQLQWLADLPLVHQEDAVLLVHASAHLPHTWRYVYDERAATESLNAALQRDPQVRYVMGGHVHQQSLYYRGAASDLLAFTPQAGVAIPVSARRQWVCTVGSVGQPRDGNARAMYAILDTDQARLSFHRVAYDNQGASEAIRRAGLPDFFAQRLGTGQ
jgi:diadenosine tetraphosphatase ApaH/serine/threonine PP2A family protein phosphatase